METQCSDFHRCIRVVYTVIRDRLSPINAFYFFIFICIGITEPSLISSKIARCYYAYATLQTTLLPYEQVLIIKLCLHVLLFYVSGVSKINFIKGNLYKRYHEWTFIKYNVSTHLTNRVLMAFFFFFFFFFFLYFFFFCLF